MTKHQRNSLLKSVILFSLLSLFIGCATIDRPEPEVTYDPTQPRPDRVPPNISLSELRDILRMNHRKNDLGFQEEKFNECEVGVSNRQNSGCYDWHLTVINLQLLCRNSSGTVQSLSAQDLRPLRNQNLQWRLGRVPGQTQLDREGYGQILALTPISPRNHYLRLTSGENFLRMSAASARFIVVPEDWC